MKTTTLALAALAAVGAWSWGGGSISSQSWIARANAMPVYDSANYAQNLVQAARSLEQINNQVKSLQNEASMLASLDKHLKRVDFKELGGLTDRLKQIDRLMGKAEGIRFKVGELEREYQTLFPKSLERDGPSQRIEAARGQLDAAMAAFKHSMSVQAQVVENVSADAAALKALADKSQGAEGSLQATQATNQLLALAAKQQLQLQSLLASQFRSQAVNDTRRIRSEQEGRSSTRRFLGNGKAYSPR